MTPSLAKKLYQEIILSHHRAPHHFGPLPAATHRAKLSNPLCGDEVTISALVDGDVVSVCHFEGHGCALCRASASLLTDAIQGQNRHAIEQLSKLVFAFLQDSADSERDDRARADSGRLWWRCQGAGISPRRRCATLPWEALQQSPTSLGLTDVLRGSTLSPLRKTTV